jgi:hypothetical protein
MMTTTMVRRHCRRTGNNPDLGARHLFRGLRRIAAIRKHARSTAGYCQRCTGTCKSSEITKIGEMCDKQPLKAGFDQTAAQLANAMNVIH